MPWTAAFWGSPRYVAVLLVLLFLVVRGAHLVWSWSTPLAKDALEYDHLAWATAKGEAWVNWREGWNYQFGPPGTPTAIRTPGLPLLGALIYSVVGHEPVVVRAVLVLLNALATGLLFDAVRRMWGTRPATLIALAWTFWPVSVRALYYVDSFLAESFALPLIILALWLLVFDGLRSAVLAGVALGLAVLSRPHLALAAPIAVVLAMLGLRRAPASRNRLIVCALVSCLCLAPWTLRNYSAFGRFMPLSSQAGIGLWFGWASGTTGSWDNTAHEMSLVSSLVQKKPELLTATEARKSDIYKQSAIEAIKERGAWSTFGHALRKAWLHVRPWETFYGLHSMLLATTVLAVLAGRTLWSSPAAILASAIYVALFLSSVLTFYLGRYRFLSTPGMLFLAGAGLSVLLERSSTFRRAAQPGQSREPALPS